MNNRFWNIEYTLCSGMGECKQLHFKALGALLLVVTHCTLQRCQQACLAMLETSCVWHRKTHQFRIQFLIHGNAFYIRENHHSLSLLYELTPFHHHSIKPRPASYHSHTIPPDNFPRMLVCQCHSQTAKFHPRPHSPPV